CFVCEQESSTCDPQNNVECCAHCPDSHIMNLTSPKLFMHMGAHILHDSHLKDADNQCGLCLNQGTLCVCLVKRGRSGDQIDMVISQCPNIYKIYLKHVVKFSKKSPCTNVPLWCPLCPKVSDAIWKYNLQLHLSKVHSSADVSLYQNLYHVNKEELVLMKSMFLAKPQLLKQKKTKNLLKISEEH
ncbi:hypothetical protein L208DRAFT_1182165, partial [Tricholoma matsutake]